jgi:hypothetical protein
MNIWRKALFLIIFLILCFSCSSGPFKKNNDEFRESINDVKTDEKFFLGMLPSWGHTSYSGRCAKNSNLKYLNFANLHKSYAITLQQAYFLQHQFNVELNNTLLESRLASLSLKDESALFHQEREKAMSERSLFVMPEFPKVIIVPMDFLLTSARSNEKNIDSQIKKLIDFLESDELDYGPLIFLSHCLNSQEIKSFLEKNKLAQYSSTIISNEFFSPYQNDFELGYHFQLHLNELLKDKQIRIYINKDYPQTDLIEILGSFEIKKLNF